MSDVVDDLLDFARGLGKGASVPMLSRSIRSAYREILAAHDWSFMEAMSRIQLEAVYSTGTITYTSSSRRVTLADGVFPANAQDMRILFDGVTSFVESRDSDTQLTLDETMRPNADVAAGTSYKIYPRWYVLPPDFLALSPPTREDDGWYIGKYITPDEMHHRERFVDTSGSTRWYTVAPAPGLYGAMALFIDPPSDSAKTLDIPYKRRPRDIRHTGSLAGENQGSISTTSGSTTVSGSGTAFQDSHVGALLRRGTSTLRPTGLDGESPYQEQRTITAVTDSGTATIDTGAAATTSGVNYIITDPIDLDVVAYDAFLRLCEYKLSRLLDYKQQGALKFDADEALFKAKSADSRIRQTATAGDPNFRSVRLTQYKSRTAVP
jgi:hypothetical protein